MKFIKMAIKIFFEYSSSDDFIIPIVNRYYSNINVIEGICDSHSIKCLFIWQPTIYTVPNDKLTEDEKIKKKIVLKSHII